MSATQLIMVSSDADRDRAIVRTVVVAAAAGAVGGALLYANARRRQLRVPKSGPFPADSLPADAFDAIIVGGGPSGSTCGYYLAKAGAKASRRTLADLNGFGARSPLGLPNLPALVLLLPQPRLGGAVAG